MIRMYVSSAFVMQCIAMYYRYDQMYDHVKCYIYSYFAQFIRHLLWQIFHSKVEKIKCTLMSQMSGL